MLEFFKKSRLANTQFSPQIVDLLNKTSDDHQKQVRVAINIAQQKIIEEMNKKSGIIVLHSQNGCGVLSVETYELISTAVRTKFNEEVKNLVETRVQARLASIIGNHSLDDWIDTRMKGILDDKLQAAINVLLKPG